jgi:probable phosphoglycerate mutase
MSIFLIRHGETAWNAARVVQPPEVPLSERGIQQAECLARRLTDAGVARILSSDLSRAEMTAQRIRATTGAPLELDPLLQERNFGEIRGTPYSELDFDLFAPDYHPPGGESWELFHQRVERAWRRIQELSEGLEGPLAVVTHGLVCHSIATRHLLLPDSVRPPGPQGPPMRFGNTALTVLRGPAPWKVELFACTRHLEGVAADGGAPSGM